MYHDMMRSNHLIGIHDVTTSVARVFSCGFHCGEKPFTSHAGKYMIRLQSTRVG